MKQQLLNCCQPEPGSSRSKLQTVTGNGEEGHTSASSDSPSPGSAPSQRDARGSGLACSAALRALSSPQPLQHGLRAADVCTPRHRATGLSLGMRSHGGSRSSETLFSGKSNLQRCFTQLPGPGCPQASGHVTRSPPPPPPIPCRNWAVRTPRSPLCGMLGLIA